MNYRMIFYIIGFILTLEAGLMLPSAGVAVYLGEWSALFAFLAAMALCLVIGLPLSIKKPKNRVIYAREGFVVVGLSWIVLSLFGALPFWFSREIPSFIDCFFETVSGFTTTGSSILPQVETLPYALLFWRSFTHWIGGMGVLVFVMAIIPLAGSRSMHLMRAEIPGPSVGKLVPRIKSTAKLLYGIYIAMTAIEVVLLLFGGMSLFDSLIHSFGTAGTGGFSSRTASVGYYDSAYIDGVITVFMLLFSINFNLFYFILIGKIGQVLRNQELRWFLGIVAAAIGVITLNILPVYRGLGDAFRHAAFQVASIISTTGFATADFALWPELSRAILLLLLIIGACAGSTGGGIKISRLLILLKGVVQEIRHMNHPRAVGMVKLEGKPVEKGTIDAANTFLVTYFIIICLSTLLVSVDGFDFESTLTAVLTCINNVGPGLGIVGPTGSFADFSGFSKLVLSITMLVGRLEIFPMIMLFSPSVWRRN